MKKMMNDTVAVAMGGTSHEAGISMMSGEAIVRALREYGLDVTPVVLESDSIDAIPRDVDAVFIALHGGYGEGGGIQADLDRIGMPYTGPGARASRIAMDKIATKEVLKKAGVPTPDYRLATLEDAWKEPELHLPLVVKPPRDGSSVGLVKVSTPEGWAEAIKTACAMDSRGEALVEAFIPGREWTVSVVDGTALPVIEICAPDGWYDFSAKYQGGTQYLFPEPDALTARAQTLALNAFHAIGCRGVSRVDFRLSPDGFLYVLEVNTVPGCTTNSLLPKAARQAGISFPELCNRLVQAAACDMPGGEA